jgi:alpha/beta superfamily hydrolase
MVMEPVTFTTEDGVLIEGELRDDVDAPRAVGVICHPHPGEGGSKDHPILWALRNELAGRHGFAALTFNFRGVMGSGGSYGGGRDEVRDVRAAMTFARGRASGVPLLLAGWSFGANVALRVSLEADRIGALALIGIPLQPGDTAMPALPDPAGLRSTGRPMLFVAGERDICCPADELRTYAEAAGAEALIVEDTDHYFWRRERELAQTIAEWAERALGLA